MINRTLSIEIDRVTGPVETPTQVYFLHVREEVFIQTASLQVLFSFDYQASARCPEHPELIIVLAFVIFERLENPTPAKRVAQPVDEATGRARIFKLTFIVVGQYLR